MKGKENKPNFGSIDDHSSFSLLSLDGDSMDHEGLNEAEVNVFLDGRFSRVSENGGFGVNNKVHCLVDVDSAHIAGSHLDEASVSVVELSFNFALHKGLAVFGLMDPLSVVIADSEADVNDISVI